LAIDGFSFNLEEGDEVEVKLGDENVFLKTINIDN